MKELKDLVKEKYGSIAKENSSCCSSSCCGDELLAVNDDYTNLAGYVADADLNLGCGIPLDAVQIQSGHTVLDLGCGAGNDVFVARQLTGSSGHVIGLDMTPEMLVLANKNKEKLGFENVTFVLGDIENMPIDSETVDVVISNCVLNLVPDKTKAFGEIFRVLKPKGRFGISDIVISGHLPEELRREAELYVGCVSGAIQEEAYLGVIEKQGFVDMEIVKEKVITLPDETLQALLNPEQLRLYYANRPVIKSITLQAVKP